jgi:hypothetical protein
MKILLRDFNAKVGMEDIFKTTVGNESLHEISTNNEIMGLHGLLQGYLYFFLFFYIF